MNNKVKNIWFPAQKYGWGWGIPCSWQGWVVLFGFIAIVIALSYIFDPEKHFLLFCLSIGLASGLLILICYLKGEKPKWRWGESNK
jgi:hypothetical protein